MTQSNNNYLEFELMAPGKIILFGEHSVVYGKKAVAATLGLYTKLHLKETNSDYITLQFPDVELEETFPLNGIRECFAAHNDLKDLNLFVEIFECFYKKYGKKKLMDGQRYSLITFFHSLSCYAQSCSGFILRVETDLPVSSGAGSSASFSVIVTTAVLLMDLVKSNKLSEFVIRSGNEFKINDELRGLISEKAFSCEKIFHGTPSGIDHSVILHGSALEFVKGFDGNNSIRTIDGGKIRVLLVNTKVLRSTKKQVEIFRSWKEKFPEIMRNVLDAMDEIAKSGIQTLKEMRNSSELEKYESRLADLISINHGLLRSVEISHESLESVFNVAKKHGLSAKLTGAGGGGFAFIYISSKTSASTIQCLKEELKVAGFEANEVILGGPGLTIKSLSF